MKTPRQLRRGRVIKVLIVGVIAVGLFRSRGRGFTSWVSDTPQATEGPRIPRFTSEALDGKKWTFPDDLTAKWTIIAIAFTQDQQDEVDTWVPAVDGLLTDRSDVAFFEFPTLTNRGYYDNPVFRKTLASGMRSGIPSPIARARTITTFVKVDPFLREMGLEGTDSIHVVLVDKRGYVKWHTTGPVSENATGQLLKKLGPSNSSG
jgi:hypothetical protein